MGLVLYLFAAVAALMAFAWAVYVLPVPGDMSAWELTGAMVPALLLMGGVLALMLALLLLLRLAGLVRRWLARR
jgi:H+/gluconate symporter-like permease